MKTKSTSTLVAAALALGLSFITPTASADWPCHFSIEVRPVYPAYPEAPGYSDYRPACPPPSYTAPRVCEPRSDYPTHLQASYRCGYWAGVEARRNGWGRDYHGAFIATGSSWESYFQEGYADGYDCHGMRH